MAGDLATELLELAPRPTAVVGVDRALRYASSSWRQAHSGATPPLDDDGARAALEVALSGGVGSWRSAKGRYQARPFGVDHVEGALVELDPTRVAPEEPKPIAPSDQQAFQQALFERSPIGLNLCRMDGLWLESNPAFLDIIGYDKEEADGGLSYWQLTPREYDDAEQEQLASLRERGIYGPYEKEFVRKDGTRVPVRLHGFTVEREGQLYIWSHIEDLRRQRKLEAELELERLRSFQASKLATLGEMTASLAHEINNPLMIIEAFASMLGPNAKPERVLEARDEIHGAVARVARLVRELRDYSRKPGRAPSFEAVSLRRVAETAIELCVLLRRSAGVTVTLDDGPEVTLTCEPLSVEQILVNLINNAIDAARESDAEDKRVVLRVEQAEDARVVVEDSGPGVPPELQQRIFESFFTTKPAGAGTGLGLAVSRELAQRQGGDVFYDATTGRSTFVLRLPLARQPGGK